MSSHDETTNIIAAGPVRGDRASSLQQILDRVFREVRARARTVARDAVVASLAVQGAPALVGCSIDSVPVPRAGTLATLESGLDWVHDEGTKNTDKVAYMGSYWTQSTGCGTRGGCTGLDVFLKVRVKRQEGANLSLKKVGVYCAAPFCATEGTTAVGNYHGDLGDNWEEWHVPVAKTPWDVGAFTFTAWYQDGLGSTFYDDNEGEWHVAPYKGTPIVLRHDWPGTGVNIGDGGVSGTISMLLASLDFDKQLRLVFTTDGWKTSDDFVIGPAGKPNGWHWVENLGNGYERWKLDLDIPGGFERFEYAVLYRHGVKGGATVYDFWDNNGGPNYVTVKGAYHVPQE